MEQLEGLVEEDREGQPHDHDTARKHGRPCLRGLPEPAPSATGHADRSQHQGRDQGHGSQAGEDGTDVRHVGS